MVRELDPYDSEETTSFSKEIEPMTRAEWAKQARAECEKELEYYEELRRRAEALWNEEGDGEQAERVLEEEDPFVGHCRYVELSPNTEEEQAEAEESEVEDAIQLSKLEESASSSFRWSYLSKFTVRLITAVIIALTVITIDYFGIGTSVLDSDAIKTTIQRNDSIESVEESVTTFAKDKVIPIFQKSQ